jgi:uncharacterized protein (DUF1501 family)
MSKQNRREFLRQVLRASPLGAAAPLYLNLGAISSAAAQSSGNSGYKALVCIFLQGGNDSFNTVLATDTTSWNCYTKQRRPRDGSTSIALMEPGTSPATTASGALPERLGGVLPISHAGRPVHSGRQFALHPALSNVQQMHQAGQVAVLANVGPLTRPTTKADFADARASKPPKLFSHNDQQSVWQSFKPEGSASGWGGLMGDLLRGGNGAGRNEADKAIVQRSFTCMTPASDATWLTGQTVLPYQSNAVNISGLGDGSAIYGSAGLRTAIASIMGSQLTASAPRVAASNLFASGHQKIAERSLATSSLLSSNFPSNSSSVWGTPNVNNPYSDPRLQYVSPVDGVTRINPLALQLQMVARMIDANRAASLGMTRQFFMVKLGGFDVHDRLISAHGETMAQLNHALAYFDGVLSAMPVGDMRAQVTTFTASEFGRTMTSNGEGSDHGWGGHHLIMGGAVIGGEVYGSFPQYSAADIRGAFSSPDQIQNGVVIPTTSVDQYAYTLGKWMGVSHSNLQAILPNLSQFNSSTYDLGFMRA